jgi:hypothetical protein
MRHIIFHSCSLIVVSSVCTIVRCSENTKSTCAEVFSERGVSHGLTLQADGDSEMYGLQSNGDFP